LQKKAPLQKGSKFVYDDGLTDLERKQRITIPIFLTGSAKSQKDSTSIRPVEEAKEASALDKQVVFFLSFVAFNAYFYALGNKFPDMM